jgi:hypothetical protein
MMPTSELSKLPIDTAIAIAKHKLDAAFALELEHDRERMLMDGLEFDTIDALIDGQIVQYLAMRNEHLAELRGRLAQRDRRRRLH